MSMTDVEYDILDQAADDYTGLWELVWWVRSHSSLDAEEEIVSIVGPALDRLLREGLVDLYVAGWQDQRVHGLAAFERLEPLPEDWQALVSWRAEDDQGYAYWIGITPPGLRAYEAEASKRADGGYSPAEQRRTPH